MEIFLSALLKIGVNFFVIFAIAFLLSSSFPMESVFLFFGVAILAIALVEVFRFVYDSYKRRNETIKMLDSAASVLDISNELHNDFRSNLRTPYNNLHNRDHILSLFINAIGILLYLWFQFNSIGLENIYLKMVVSLGAAIPLSLAIALLANTVANAVNMGVFKHIETLARPEFVPITESWKVTEKSLKFDVKNADFTSLFGLRDLTPHSLADIIFFVDLDKREKMIKVLQRVKDPQAAATIARFMELYPARHGFAVGALVKCKDRAIEPLKELLQNENSLVKQAAMNALAGIKTPDAIAALVEMLNDRNVDVKRAAIWDLNEENSAWTKGPSGDRARQILLRSLSSCQAEERAFAAWALGMIKAQASAVQLKDLLVDNHAIVRENAVFALGELRELVVQEDIEKSLDDPDKLVRKSALVALRKINPERAMEIVSSH
jgi:hypothetical protein